MNVSLTLTACVEGSFCQMFFQGSTSTIGIGMELKQSLRQTAISQAVFSKQSLHYIMAAMLFYQSISSHTKEKSASIIEGVIKSKLTQIGKESLLCLTLGFLAATLEEGKQVLKHATGSTTCWHKLSYLMPFGLIFIPLLYIELLAFGSNRKDVGWY